MFGDFQSLKPNPDEHRIQPIGASHLALRALWPRDNGKTADFTGDMEMSSAFSDLLALRQVLADAIAREAQVKQRIQQRMGEATTARFDAGEVRWKRSKDSAAVDVDRLLVDQPELASTYSVPRPGSRRFTVKVHESLTLAAPSSAADE